MQAHFPTLPLHPSSEIARTCIIRAPDETTRLHSMRSHLQQCAAPLQAMHANSTNNTQIPSTTRAHPAPPNTTSAPHQIKRTRTQKKCARSPPNHIRAPPIKPSAGTRPRMPTRYPCRGSDQGIVGVATKDAHTLPLQCSRTPHSTTRQLPPNRTTHAQNQTTLDHARAPN